MANGSAKDVMSNYNKQVVGNFFIITSIMIWGQIYPYAPSDHGHDDPLESHFNLWNSKCFVTLYMQNSTQNKVNQYHNITSSSAIHSWAHSDYSTLIISRELSQRGQLWVTDYEYTDLCLFR
jgi:hypothetical protein